jgi:steroid delta-isomerase-like uncharacterized protein
MGGRLKEDQEIMSDNYPTIAHRWFGEVWNKGRVEAIDDMFAEDGIAHGLGDVSGSDLQGPAAFKPFVQSFRAIFPDINVAIEDTICEGDKIVARCTVRGTHLGSGNGIAATGRLISFDGICILRVKDGKIVEGWNSFDFLSMFRQMEAR